MDFISNQEFQIKEMLQELGIADVDALFCAVPKELKLQRPVHDDGLSEFEGMRLMEEIASKNSFSTFTSYLGGGAYHHHVPALVSAVTSKSELLTAYTPYQAESSQGMLQLIFEFQSAICALTGMDVSNASLYDGAGAAAEALLMAMRLNKGRTKVVIGASLHPHYRAVIEQYLSCHGMEIIEIPYTSSGQLDKGCLKDAIDKDTAAVLIQSPNFFGVIEDVSDLVPRAKEHGVLTILSANPLSYGLYASAGELGVDIAVGDVQPFGLSLQFGGPYAGYLACRTEILRQMPGRIVGETRDADGKRGFVLTLQAREQHIRREKATSNICTNQTLAAIASLVAMLWYGREGVCKLALTNYQRAAFLKARLKALSGVSTFADAPFFNEFPVSFGLPADQVQAHFRKMGIEPGLHLGRFNQELKGFFLVAVTETKSKQQLTEYLQVAKALLKSGGGQ